MSRVLQMDPALQGDENEVPENKLWSYTRENGNNILATEKEFEIENIFKGNIKELHTPS